MARFVVRVSVEVPDDVTQTQVREFMHRSLETTHCGACGEPDLVFVDLTDKVQVMHVRRNPARHCRTPGKR